jgi:hypothetical protein
MLRGLLPARLSGLATVLLALCAAASAAPSKPLLKAEAVKPGAIVPAFADLKQQTAEPLITGPATKTCSVTLMQDKQFRNTAYPPANPQEPDRNFSGTYTPPAACPGPWAKVVLNVATKINGVQFDRLLDVYLGGALILSSSTSEPCCTGNASDYVSWTAQRDVTAYAALLNRAQPVSIDLGNVVDSTYTGIYVSTATLSFYQASAAAPAPASADFVTGVHSQVDNLQQDGYYQVNQPGQVATQSVVFPRNLERLQAELFAQGHGACEEFWWGEPGGCGTGTPYREVAVYLDGRLAGAAPVFPVTFTGADGPGFWEPIPSPRAWNLKPYRVDLSPFVGTLTDGAAHQVGLAALDASYPQSDVWDLAANLHGWVDHGASRVSGVLVSADAAAAPTDDARFDRSGQIEYTDHASHSLDFSGWVQTSGGRITTTVHQAMSADSSQLVAAGAVQTKWDWQSSSTVLTQPPGAAAYASVSNDHQTYGIVFTPETHFTISESEQAIASTPQGLIWSDYDRSMETSDATGIAYNGASSDHYRYADSSGACIDRRIVGLAGLIVSDRSDSRCQQEAGAQ